MAINPQEFAKMLGAEIVGEVPDVGGGPFGMARLAYIMHQRLTPSCGERPGRPTDSSWETRPKVPMSEATQRRLADIAAKMSTQERRVSPMQIAAQLLEEAVKQIALETEAAVEETESAQAKSTVLKEVQVKQKEDARLCNTDHSSDRAATSGETQAAISTTEKLLTPPVIAEDLARGGKFKPNKSRSKIKRHQRKTP